MNSKEEAQKVAENFDKYLKSGGDKSLIEQYSINELKQAKRYLHKPYGNKVWYEEIDKRIAFLEKIEEDKRSKPERMKHYFWDKIFPILLTGIIAFVSGIGLKMLEVADLKNEIAELKNKIPEIPVRVVHKSTGNELYIDKPIAHPNYYEFPITLNDGMGQYRIDQYKYLNQFKGALIVNKNETQQPDTVVEKK